MKSSIVKRTISIVGHKTAVSLEAPFWELLKEIAQTRGQTLSDLVAKIDQDREHANRSSAIRLFVLGYVHDEITRSTKFPNHALVVRKTVGALDTLSGPHHDRAQPFFQAGP